MKFSKKNILEKVEKIENIEAVYLFGSYARNESNENSDIDICIIGNLERNEKIEILSLFSEKVDISFFNELPIFIKIRVFSEGKEILIREDKKNFIEDLKWRTLQEFIEFLPFIQKRMEANFNVR